MFLIVLYIMYACCNTFSLTFSFSSFPSPFLSFFLHLFLSFSSFFLFSFLSHYIFFLLFFSCILLSFLFSPFFPLFLSTFSTLSSKTHLYRNLYQLFKSSTFLFLCNQCFISIIYSLLQKGRNYKCHSYFALKHFLF